jgi:hypothetical protein
MHGIHSHERRSQDGILVTRILETLGLPCFRSEAARRRPLHINWQHTESHRAIAVERLGITSRVLFNLHNRSKAAYRPLPNMEVRHVTHASEAELDRMADLLMDAFGDGRSSCPLSITAARGEYGLVPSVLHLVDSQSEGV